MSRYSLPEAFQLFHETQNVGKHIKKGKKRVTWRFCFEDDDDEHSVVLVHTLSSGKKRIFLNGALIFTEQKVRVSKSLYAFSAGDTLGSLSAPWWPIRARFPTRQTFASRSHQRRLQSAEGCWLWYACAWSQLRLATDGLFLSDLLIDSRSFMSLRMSNPELRARRRRRGSGAGAETRRMSDFIEEGLWPATCPS